MKEIKLNTGNVTIVDDQDFDWLQQFKWTEVYGYAKRSTKSMHREILQRMGVETTGKDTDHINGNKLDNRRENLRTATRAQNVLNTGIRSTNTSGYKGVSVTPSGKWRARLYVDSKQYSLGIYDDITEAALAYNKAAVEHFGEFARINVFEDR